jgi:hypothetical protein
MFFESDQIILHLSLTTRFARGRLVLNHHHIFYVSVGPQIGMNPISVWGLPDLEY